MKKRLSLILAMLMMCTLTALGNLAIAETTTPVEAAENKSNILVAYFSSAGNIKAEEAAVGNVGKGNTKTVAELIGAQVGAELFFIETVDKYPSNYRDAIGVAMQELRAGTKPALVSRVENLGDYDVIFLGYPNWWGTLPQSILTFLDENDLSGKTVIPFCTYEDTGFGRSIQDLQKLLPNATLLEGIAIAQHDLSNAQDTVKEWISALDLQK